MRLGSLAALVLCVAVALSGCRAADTKTPPRSIRATTLRLSCSESWIPTGRTFKGFGAWRRTSIRIGPVTLMGARAAATRNVAAYGSIKFRMLVRPETRLTIAIAPDAMSAVGFVAPEDALRSIFPDHGAAILALAPCPGVPADLQAIPGLADIGYPMFLRVRRNACVGLAVTEVPGRTFRGTVSIGAQHCERVS